MIEGDPTQYLLRNTMQDGASEDCDRTRPSPKSNARTKKLFEAVPCCTFRVPSLMLIKKKKRLKTKKKGFFYMVVFFEQFWPLLGTFSSEWLTYSSLGAGDGGWWR